MEKLIRGVHEFQESVFGPQRELFTRLARGQEPLALFVTCSDSRVQPNLLTQTEPGDLFILRNAGNVVPPYGQVGGGEDATIEYAVSVLKITDIVVCGHTECGAIRALLEPETVKDLPAIQRWLARAEGTRRIVAEKYAELSHEQRLVAAVKEHVLYQLENLRTHPAVASGIATGRVKLHGWVYDLVHGHVFAYAPQQSQFVPLSEAAVPMPREVRAGGE